MDRERKIDAKYEDYDWLELVISSKINGSLVLKLDIVTNIWTDTTYIRSAAKEIKLSR